MLKSDVENDIVKTVYTQLRMTERPDGTVASVPDPAKMGYSEGLYLPSTYLYADMADSSGLVAVSPPSTVARVMKAYLSVCTRIIRAHEGHIRSFDGDRVMGIFAGADRDSRAVEAALRIKWSLQFLVQPAIEKQFRSVQQSGWTLKHACGVAEGRTLLVRAGFRGNDDMISIGVAPNLAAKLSDKRQARFSTFIAKSVYENLTEEVKLSKGVNMWEGPYKLEMGGKIYSYYKSSYRRRI